ncbi:MAG: hypothetical protein H6999_05310 [Hahellaceae bacterium]|nr:hypothetical protein [Hahellaceae bacterium]MCP5169156.1 hypothetical protein [Hahellaceae bacterium]
MQFRRGQPRGHYESYFIRANHPSKPQAIWIRYTLFQPRHRPDLAIGELWAIWSDADRSGIVAVQQDIPLPDCVLGSRQLTLGGASLSPQSARGSARSEINRITWDLTYDGGQSPLLCLPDRLYRSPLPKAKLMVMQPNARFNGRLEVNGEIIEIHQWQGSVNHNWGSKHTDAYAWGQVAGFDRDPESFFEVATARLKLGPLWTPPLTLAVLRHQGQEYRFNQLTQALKATARYHYFEWQFELANDQYELQGSMRAPAHLFAGLHYKNPPGGLKTCLNSKLAQCDLYLSRRGATPTYLTTAHRGAFEILTDAPPPDIRIVN